MLQDSCLMVFTVHGIVPPSCCMYLLGLRPRKYIQPSRSTYPIHCKNNETTITCIRFLSPISCTCMFLSPISCTCIRFLSPISCTCMFLSPISWMFPGCGGWPSLRTSRPGRALLTREPHQAISSSLLCLQSAPCHCRQGTCTCTLHE